VTLKDGRLSYHVRMVRIDEDHFRVSTPEGRSCRIEIVRRPLPRHGGHAILYRCPRCGRLQRHLDGVSLVGDHSVDDGMRCHRCAKLLFRSQGRYRSRLERNMFEASQGIGRGHTSDQGFDRGVDGRPAWGRPESVAQWRRKRRRWQLRTVAGATMTRACLHAGHTLDSPTHRRRSLRRILGGVVARL
jgi:hypothetical protein